MLVVRRGQFAPEFQERNEGEDLPLSIDADSVPECWGVGLAGERRTVELRKGKQDESGRTCC